MFDKLEANKKRFAELENELAKGDVIANQELYTKLVKEHSSLSDIVNKYSEYLDNHAQIGDLKLMAFDKDEEIAAMAKEELGQRQQSEKKITEELKFVITSYSIHYTKLYENML